MTYKLVDYKGKYYVIQDRIDPDDWFDIECGEITDEQLTDEFLKGHVAECLYFGIPAYSGDNKELQGRIDTFYEELNK